MRPALPLLILASLLTGYATMPPDAEPKTSAPTVLSAGTSSGPTPTPTPISQPASEATMTETQEPTVGEWINGTYIHARLINATREPHAINLTWELSFTDAVPPEGLRLRYGVRGLSYWGEEIGRPSTLTFNVLTTSHGGPGQGPLEGIAYVEVAGGVDQGGKKERAEWGVQVPK